MPAAANVLAQRIAQAPAAAIRQWLRQVKRLEQNIAHRDLRASRHCPVIRPPRRVQQMCHLPSKLQRGHSSSVVWALSSITWWHELNPQKSPSNSCQGRNLARVGSGERRLVEEVPGCPLQAQRIRWRGIPNPASEQFTTTVCAKTKRHTVCFLPRREAKDPLWRKRAMSIAKTSPRASSNRKVARRQAHIRSAWSPWERRERARQATAQMGLLWALIQSGSPTNPS
jgi:hypothetical protein